MLDNVDVNQTADMPARATTDGSDEVDQGFARSDAAANETIKQVGILSKDAASGNLTLAVDAAEFVRLDKVCADFEATIREIRVKTQAVADQSRWGLGDDTRGMGPGGNGLSTAMGLVDRLRHNGREACDSLDTHLKATEDIRAMLWTIRDRYAETDSHFKAELERLVPPAVS